MSDPQKYFRWDDVTKNYVETTENDPRRLVFKSDVDAQASRALLFTALGTVVGYVATKRLFDGKSRR